MKSFSRIYPHAEHEQLEAWNPSDLVIELAEPAESIQQEQVLAILRKGEGDGAAEHEPGPRSSLLRRATGLAVTAWQPGEMDWQTPFVNNSEGWNFPPSPPPPRMSPRIWNRKFGNRNSLRKKKLPPF